MQGQGLIGLGMRMLQGGEDKTGYGDLYDSLGVTRGRSQDPAKLLAAALASMEMGDDEDVTSTVVEDMQGLMGDEQRMFGDDTGKPTFREKYLGSFLDLFSPDDDFEPGSNTYASGGEVSRNTYASGGEADLNKYKRLHSMAQFGLMGLESIPMDLIYSLLGVSGFEDGGRVEMQQGGMPMAGQQPMGSVAELLTMAGQQPMGPTFRTADFRDYNNDGVDDRDQPVNPPTGNELPIGPRPPLLGDPGFDPTLPPDYQGPSYDFFSQFRTMGPAYGAPMQPQTFQQPSEPFQFGMDIGDYLGGPDPFAVSYNPYVNATGTEDAYGQYGLNMGEDEIMDAFSDLDKYSLAAQEAKRKAEEEAAKKAQQVVKVGGGGGGDGGGSSPSAGGPTGPGGQSPGPQGQRGGTPN